jgi:uncharacterized protein (TIGR02453 family)
MSDGFAELIPRAIDFFLRLKADNTKTFYEAHKAFYRDEILKPAELLSDLMAEDIARATGKPHVPKVFRIHRDVRFSKDKTPYNTHLHMMWSRGAEAKAPAWFFGAAPDYLTFGMGVMGLEKDTLSRYRQMIDEDGDDLTDAHGHRRGPRQTSRCWTGAPNRSNASRNPYDADHPHAELLKRKAFAVHAPLPAGLAGPWPHPQPQRSRSGHAADLAHAGPHVSGLTQPLRPMGQDDRHDQVLLVLEVPPDQPLQIRQPIAQRPGRRLRVRPAAPCIAPFACSTNRFRIPSSAW